MSNNCPSCRSLGDAVKKRGGMVGVLGALLCHPGLTPKEREEALRIASSCGSLEQYADALPARARAILTSLVTNELLVAASDAGIVVAIEGSVA